MRQAAHCTAQIESGMLSYVNNYTEHKCVIPTELKREFLSRMKKGRGSELRGGI
jgi:hypothetical protein